MLKPRTSVYPQHIDLRQQVTGTEIDRGLVLVRQLNKPDRIYEVILEIVED